MTDVARPSETPIADRIDTIADRLSTVHMLLARELRPLIADVARMERDSPGHIEPVIRRVEEAELFEDGVEADLADIGVTSIADAYMTGRQQALSDLRQQLGLPPHPGGRA